MATLRDTLYELQAPVEEVRPRGTQTATGLILPPRRSVDRLSHFDDNVYDLHAESHLVRFLKVLLGDTGVGGPRKRMMMSRLTTALHGTHFYALDRFWGALFNVSRMGGEQLDLNPYTDLATAEEWFEQHSRDGSYRSRITQLAIGFNLGATIHGVETATEALLNVDSDVYELWRVDDDPTALAASLGRTGSRKEFVVRPRRTLTEGERYDLRRALEPLKPVDSVMTVDEGVAVYTPVTLRGARADSEYWEVTSHVIRRNVGVHKPYGEGTGEAQEKPRPPFSAYQGEAWSYNGDTAAIISYASDSDQTNFERVTFLDGYHLDYVPIKALLSQPELLAGRMVSDGMMVSSPYATEQARFQSGTADIYVDRIPLSEMAKVIDDESVGMRKVVRLPSQQFWATTERDPDDRTAEYLEVRFNEPRTVNFVSFDTARFPHEVEVQRFDETTGSWVKMFSKTVRDSEPSSFRQLQPQTDYRHPMHLGPDHWMEVSRRVEPVDIERLRLKLVRVNGSPPVDVRGKALPYSLAVQDLDIGYRLTSLSDIPEANVDTNDRHVASTVDALDTRVKFALHRQRAQGLFEEPTKPWKSEPMPSPEAVVSLYLDTRTEEGEAQTIARLFLEPLTEGPQFNIYASNEVPTNRFTADSDPLTNFISETGEVLQDANRTDFDSDAPAWLDIDTFPLQFNSTEAWWLGLRVASEFAADDPDIHPIIDLDGHVLAFHPSEVRFTTFEGLEVSIPTSFPIRTVSDVVLAHLPEATDDYLPGLHLWFRSGTDGPLEHARIPIPEGEVVSRPGVVRVGGHFDRSFSGRFDESDLIGGIYLYAAVLKESDVPTPEVLDDFISDPQGYVTRPRYPSDGPDRTTNAILRYAPTFSTEAHPYGFVGGPGNNYEEMSWTPVTRDYILRKGFVDLPPTYAKFIKLEFTNLVAEPFETFVPVEQKVRFYPPDAKDRLATRSHTVDAQDAIIGMDTIVGSVRRFDDGFDRFVAGLRTTDRDHVTPTETMYALDPEARDRLRERYWSYGFAPWHLESRTPRFAVTGQHNYDVRNMARNTNLAYFVGLKRAEVYKVDYLVDDDTPVYYERFHDLEDVETNAFTHEPGRLTTGNASFGYAESETLLSRSNVAGVQFASQQSPPVQLAPDDDFRNEEFLTGYDFETYTHWHRVGDSTLTYRPEDHTVRVERQVAIQPYGDLDGMPYGDTGTTPDEYPTADDLEDFTYGQLQAWSTREDEFGGIETPVIFPSESGRVHAAVRVTAPEDLDSPLYLQILNDEGEVLIEAPRMLLAGETAEWYVGHTIGSIGDYTIYFYGDHESRTYRGNEDMGDYRDLERFVEYQVSDFIQVRLVQKGPSVNAFRIDTLSVFDDAIVWEFSPNGGGEWYRAEDIRNNVNGAIRFSEPANQLRWRVRAHRPNISISSLQIRPWYVNRPADRSNRVGSQRGPNLVPMDTDRPIQEDPEFKRWSLPIPQTWFRAYRGRTMANAYEAQVYVPPGELVGTESMFVYAYVDVEQP